MCCKDTFVCCDTRERPGLYSSDIVGSYIYFKTTQTGWQLARVVGLAEDAESMSLPHTIKMLDLGKQYNVHSLNYQPSARSVVLARTPENSERQELHGDTGIERIPERCIGMGGRQLRWNSSIFVRDRPGGKCNGSGGMSVTKDGIIIRT